MFVSFFDSSPIQPSGAIAGLAVGLAVGAVLVGVLIALLVQRHRRTRDGERGPKHSVKRSSTQWVYNTAATCNNEEYTRKDFNEISAVAGLRSQFLLHREGQCGLGMEEPERHWRLERCAFGAAPAANENDAVVAVWDAPEREATLGELEGAAAASQCHEIVVHWIERDARGRLFDCHGLARRRTRCSALQRAHSVCSTQFVGRASGRSTFGRS